MAQLLVLALAATALWWIWSGNVVLWWLTLVFAILAPWTGSAFLNAEKQERGILLSQIEDPDPWERIQIEQQVRRNPVVLFWLFTSMATTAVSALISVVSIVVSFWK
jgi:hypothetical protein